MIRASDPEKKSATGTKMVLVQVSGQWQPLCMCLRSYSPQLPETKIRPPRFLKDISEGFKLLNSFSKPTLLLLELFFGKKIIPLRLSQFRSSLIVFHYTLSKSLPKSKMLARIISSTSSSQFVTCQLNLLTMPLLILFNILLKKVKMVHFLMHFHLLFVKPSVLILLCF